MRKLLLPFVFSLALPVVLLACCAGEPHNLSELLIEDSYNRSVFTCRVLYPMVASDFGADYRAKAVVLEVFKGEIKQDTITLHTGGNNSAGGKLLQPNDECLVFGHSRDGVNFGAFVCDLFSFVLNHEGRRNYDRSWILSIVKDFNEKTHERYTGDIHWKDNEGKTVAIGKMLNGLAEGEWKHFQGEKPHSEAKYENGKLHGKYVRYGYEGKKNAQYYNHGELLNSDTKMRDKAGNQYINKKRVWEETPYGKLEEEIILNSNGDTTFQASRWQFSREDREWHHGNIYEGEYLQTDENGNITFKGKYYKGAKVGKWVETHHRTKKQTEKTYPMPNETGLSGFYRFHENGNLAVQGKLIKGKAEGLWKFYHDNGKLSQEAFFVYGKKEGEVRRFQKDTLLVSYVTHFRNGVKDGPHIGYQSNGNPHTVGSYLQGLEEGLWLNLLPSGDTLNLTHYKKGEYHGLMIKRNRDGQLVFKGTFENGVLQGMAEEYARFGDACFSFAKGRYENGFKVGEWIKYDCEGKPMQKCQFSLENREYFQQGDHRLSGSNCVDFD